MVCKRFLKKYTVLFIGLYVILVICIIFRGVLEHGLFAMSNLKSLLTVLFSLNYFLIVATIALILSSLSIFTNYMNSKIATNEQKEQEKEQRVIKNTLTKSEKIDRAIRGSNQRDD